MFRITTLFLACLCFGTMAQSAEIVFATDPFAGTMALTDPGRQIVGGAGTLVNFNPATDTLVVNSGIFDVHLQTSFFASGLDTELPTSGVNFIVIRNTGTPFLAGTAANLIAARLDETSPFPGFFIYFNTNLQVARLVYSTDLNENTADLAVLARLSDFSGPEGLEKLGEITGADFGYTPEPSTFLLTAAGALALCVIRWRALNRA